MSESQLRVLQGTLELLILKTLAWEPNHGFGILRHLETVTRERLIVEEGALYPALHRMRERGWIEGEWGKTENNRRALVYRLTPSGREELRRQQSEWSRMVDVMALALEPASP
ncbi:MAG: PadR family transcriptional regulator [Gemmatimonadota bacterium]|nr:PadR family transcriptional regulator [Gemmatimonadota bacterium]